MSEFTLSTKRFWLSIEGSKVKVPWRKKFIRYQSSDGKTKWLHWQIQPIVSLTDKEYKEKWGYEDDRIFDYNIYTPNHTINIHSRKREVAL